MAINKGNTLGLNCTELQMEIPTIQNESVCADLGTLFENANALSFDVTNKRCSIQQCTSKDNILAVAVAHAKLSVMFESAFYPKGKFIECFNFNQFCNISQLSNFISPCHLTEVI